MLATDNWWDYVNPFSYLGDAAGKVAADAWTAAMLGLWNCGLWLLKLILTLEDAFLTPDLSENGPGRVLYQATFWIAVSLVVLMVMVQLCFAAVRRDGQSLARVLIGTGQFVMVWAAWIGYAVGVLAACGGLTSALMQSLLHIDAWAGFQPWAAFTTKDISDGTLATVLGVMGLVLIFAAIGHALVMMTRAGALMVLCATTPICAAGLVSDVGRAWFWKSFRWFHAAALTPVVMILILGVGVQMTSGVANGYTDSLQKAIGTAVPGIILILIGCFAPLALFKLLAFVDPGTSSGAALRQGMTAHGGIQGLLGGSAGGGGSATSEAASSTDSNGKSQAESAGEDSTGQRFTHKAGGFMGAVGAVGQGASATLGAVSTLGAKGAAIGADLSNQMGVGHNSYQPDFSATKSKGSSSGSPNGQGNGASQGPRDGDNPDINGSGGGADQVADPATAATGTDGAFAAGSRPEGMPPLPTPPGPTPGTGGGAAEGSPGVPRGGSGGGGGGAAGGAEAAAGVPVVPV